MATALYVVGVGAYKAREMDRAAAESLELARTLQPRVHGLFQASFYFFYDDQFLPGVLGLVKPTEDRTDPGAARLERVEILTADGSVLFDSSVGGTKPEKGEESGRRHADARVPEALKSDHPTVFSQGFGTQVLLPPPAGSPVGVRLSFDLPGLRRATFWALGVGIALIFLLWRGLEGGRAKRLGQTGLAIWRRFWRLRIKFLATILLINSFTVAIVFTSLVSLQTRQQTYRIQKDALVFAEFSTARIVSAFTNSFYFYYTDQFLPEIKNTIAANENLVGVRVISARTGNVLFDSEKATAPSAAGSEPVVVQYPEDMLEQLKNRDIASRRVERDGQRMLSVLSAQRGESQASLFWVEYLFSFQSLERSIQSIRSRLIRDLVPSLLFGFVVAAFFAQLLISPIRRLVAALRKVTAGDYNVSVQVRGRDEIGELVSAFNAMTDDLRKKKELRKYLSETTYRQVMASSDGADGSRQGGKRVPATVLFSDIRDFVGHCEALDAEEVTVMLNEYFAEMVEVVHKHGGEVDKFIGDALLAVFYASDEVRTILPGGPQVPTGTGTSLQAIYCGLEMRERLAEFNERRRAKGKATIEIGIGITFGDIISGPIGAKDRMDFTVIGDVVNLANRIEKLSKTGKFTKIVFSHQVEERVRGLLDYQEHSREQVRGKQEPVIVYELKGIRDLQALLANLAAPDPVLRRRCLELLGQSRNEAAVPAILGCLRDADESVRMSAAQALGRLSLRGDARVLKALRDALKAERGDRALSAIIATYGRVALGDAIFDLAPYLDHADERIVANAIEAMGNARDPRCSDLILPKVMSRHNRVKANSAMALFAAGHFEVIDSLKPMLMHSDPLMRSSAAFAIGELTVIAEQEAVVRSWRAEERAAKVFMAELQECVPMLVSLLRDPDPTVRRQAVVALGKIKDKSAVLPIIDMVDLGQGSRDLNRDILDALRSIGSHKLVRDVIRRLG